MGTLDASLGLDRSGDLAASLAAGWTLPASWYADPAVHALERDRIFASAWQYVGRAGAVSAPGSYLAGRVGHVPVVVVRDKQGVLRGFKNVCRHRAHLVAEGEGCRATLQCPYHAWTYDLDGSLLRAPRSDREAGFDPDAFALLPVSVETWGPLVFANPDPDARPLAEHLEGVRDLVDESGVGFDSLVFRRRVTWELPVNWKNGLENYLECYHCAVAHPGLSQVVDVDADAYALIDRPLSSSQLGAVRPGVREGTATAPYRPADDVPGAQYHFLWPGTTINIEPGRPNFGIDTWSPDGPHRTVGVSDYYFGPEVGEEQVEELVAFSQQVGAEDDGLVRSVQAGLDSGVVPQGRLLLPSERLIAHFQRLVHDALIC
jgi:phenylpropionate dioxygenase-like ring-hydroxylating dioxygenase large terminal subunit